MITSIRTQWKRYRNWRKRTKKTRRRIQLALTVIFLIWYIGCLPDTLFTDDTSTVLLDRNNKLLGAHIASDGQWRFPECNKVPPKIATCIIAFEDRNFYTHLGVSLKGIVRALIQNSNNGKIVSGGSTITMQVVRLMRKNPPRTYSEKVIEMILATRLEWRYNKPEILALYASHAPFGNNVVGVDAAAWRYFGRSADELSWAESATLAVLPNAPGLIYPGKNHDRLLKKRNRLLLYLYQQETIDRTTYEMALNEPLPDKPVPLPRLAPHLLDHYLKGPQRGTTIHTTIDKAIQERASLQLALHHQLVSDNNIMNGAVMVTDVKTGEILAYVGNTTVMQEEYSGSVDCIRAPRSTGSILKPLLYAKCMEAGQLTPTMLIPDVPSQFGSFSPKNYSGSFDGAVHANRALSKSLNIPMVHLLNRYGTAHFRDDLRHYGFSTINRSAKNYGLSLILGGAEVRLFDLNTVYTQMAQELRFGKSWSLRMEKNQQAGDSTTTPHTDPGCIYTTFEALLEVNRPDEDNNWKIFSSSRKIAWKTGTSFGFRDAWAVGVTPDYVVSVWMGNADGEGRPGLTGVKAAAPLMFSVFHQLPQRTEWFSPPKKHLTTMEICRESGHRAGKYCLHTLKKTVPKTCLATSVCPYHQNVFLNKEGTLRVDSECANVFDMQKRTVFLLPPVIEKYYASQHPDYIAVPPFDPACLAKATDGTMHIVYPKENSTIYVPLTFEGKPGEIILEAGHRNSGAIIYWHLDETFLGETKGVHQLSLNPPAGEHTLQLIDESGLSVVVHFGVVEKR